MIKKIISNIIFVIVGLLALAFIMLAVIPKSYAVGVNYEPYQIRVYGSNTSSFESFVKSGTTEDTYNKLSDMFQNSFSTTSLDALFSKNLGFDSAYTYDASSYLSSIVSGASSSNSIVMEYKFNTLQTLQKDGKDVVSDLLKNNSKYTEGVVTYGKLWLVISDNTSFQEITIYVQKLSTLGDPVSTSTNSIYKIKTLAKTHDLYTELSTIKDNI